MVSCFLSKTTLHWVVVSVGEVIDLYQMVIITFLIAFTGFLIKNLDAMETRKHYIQAIGSHTFGRRALKRQKTIVPHTFHPPTPFFSCCEKYDAVTIKN